MLQSDGKLESFISDRIKKFSTWKQTLQPFCVAVGPSVDNINKYVVVIDQTTQFNFTTLQRCLDVCFKILHASHASYSVESHRMWMVVQLHLYKLKTVYDNARSDTLLPKILKKFE